MNKRLFIMGLATLLLLCCGCSTGRQRYTYTYLDVFDTVTDITIYADTRENADELAAFLHDGLKVYHQMTDIYREYPDMTNLCTVNRLAGSQPVAVSAELIELLLLSQQLSLESNGCLNICMGSVLSIWEAYRNAGLENPELAELPDEDQLQEAMKHVDPKKLIINTETNTISFLDPDMKLDVGAVAKGWAVQRVCEETEKMGYSGFLISAGHNVCTVGKKDKNENWKVAVENPDNISQPLTLLSLNDMSAVTSGSYQRFYTVNGIDYHHIVDPTTGYPGTKYRMVTVLHSDSGIADGLSTALFLMERQEGQILAASYGAEVLWLYSDGVWEATEGFSAFTVK